MSRLFLALPLLAACSLIIEAKDYGRGGGSDGGADGGADSGTDAPIPDGGTDANLECPDGSVPGPEPGLCVGCLMDRDCAGGAKCLDQTCVANPCTGVSSVEVVDGTIELGQVDEGTGVAGFSRVQIAPAPLPEGGWLIVGRDPSGPPTGSHWVRKMSAEGVLSDPMPAATELEGYFDCSLADLLDLELRGDGGSLSLAAVVTEGRGGARLIRGRWDDGDVLCDRSSVYSDLPEGFLAQASLDGTHTVFGPFSNTRSEAWVAHTHPPRTEIDGTGICAVDPCTPPVVVGKVLGADGAGDAIVWTLTNRGGDAAVATVRDPSNTTVLTLPLQEQVGAARMTGLSGRAFVAVPASRSSAPSADLCTPLVRQVGDSLEFCGGAELASGHLGIVPIHGDRPDEAFAVVLDTRDGLALALPTRASPDDLRGDFEVDYVQGPSEVDELDVSSRTYAPDWTEVAAVARVGSEAVVARWRICGMR